MDLWNPPAYTQDEQDLYLATKAIDALADLLREIHSKESLWSEEIEDLFEDLNLSV